MKIKFLGASGTVTGSSYVLTSESEQSIMIDLGSFQGTPDIEKHNHEPIDFDLSKLSGMILTHAHLDHCGRLPLLTKNGFNENIFCTAPTVDLTRITLEDSAKIAREDKTLEMFNSKDVENTLKKLVAIDYRNDLHLGDFQIRLRDAGHILGSSSVEIIDKNSSKDVKKIVFSGDIGNYPAQLEEKTEFIDSGDVVVMESTYGDRLHPQENPLEALRSEINAVEVSSGTLLIPTFSLDRAQELMHMIRHLKEDGKVLKETPVILDSPMAEKATIVYTKYPVLFNDHIESEAKTGSIFDFAGLEVTKNWKESERIHQRSEAKVIIAGSGMMMGGRIVNHAKYYLGDSNNRLMIVGYQGKGTLGRELLEGKKQVNVDGLNITVNATINDTQGLSAHADQEQLMKWLKNIKGVKKVFLTHGDDEAREVLGQKIKNELKLNDVTLPELNQEFEF